MTPINVLREYYQSINEENTEFSCIFCYKSYTKHVTRMCKHIVVCTEVPIEIKTIVLDMITKSNLQKYDTSDEKMDITEKHRLWEKLARAIYVSGAPFSIVENKYWLDFFHDLNPSFDLPTRKTLSTNLLDAEYDKLQELTNKKIEQCNAFGVQVDSWSNIRFEPIVNVIVTCPEPILFKSIYSETDHHTGEYYAQLVKETILKCGKNKCLSVCTDNDSTMLKVGKLLKKDPDLINLPISYYGCLAHWLNLLGNDILKTESCARIQKYITSIITSLNGSHILKERLKAIQTKNYGKVIALLLPVKTRWCYIVPSIKSFLNSRSAIEELANCPEVAKYLSVKIKSLILDETSWNEANQIYALLEPIKIWITLLETDKCVISKVPQAIKEISDHIEANLQFSPVSPTEEVVIMNSVGKRATGIMTSIHYAANILDPQFQGKNLTKEQKIEGFDYIKNVSCALKCNLTKINKESHLFMKRAEFWSLDLLWCENIEIQKNPKIWWSTFCSATELSKVAIPILSMPPTSAATERSFSAFSNIHTKKRNRLTTARAAKVVFIGKTLQIFNTNGGVLKKNENNFAFVDNDDTLEDDSCCCLQCLCF